MEEGEEPEEEEVEEGAVQHLSLLLKGEAELVEVGEVEEEEGITSI